MISSTKLNNYLLCIGIFILILPIFIMGNTRVTQTPLKSGIIKEANISPFSLSDYTYTVDVTDLEMELDRYRLIYGIGQAAHGILYYSCNIKFPNG